MQRSIQIKELPGSNRFFSHRLFCPAGSELYYMDALVFLVVLKGEGQVQYHEKTAYLQRGDFLFFPRHALFTLTDMSGLQLYEIRFRPYYFQTLCPELEGLRFRHFHITPSIDDAGRAEIYRTLTEFISAWTQEDTAQSLAAVTALSRLLMTVQMQFAQTDRVDPVPDDYIQTRITQILDLIAERYAEKLSVPEVSRILGLNPQYFSSFFSRHFGQSFVNFLNSYRVRCSIASLCDSAQALTDIAYQYGFQTYKSYVNAFQKEYGMSPSAYRRSHACSSPREDGHPAGKAMTSGVRSLAEMFDFLKGFAGTDPLGPEHASSAQVTLEMDLRHSPVLAQPHPIQAVSIGSGFQLLQDSVYRQLRRAAQECKFTHVHFRDVFSDLLNVYMEPVAEHPVFSWEYVDDVLTRITQLGFYPYIEIGFMPKDLASAPAALGYGSHPCVGAPRSLSLWQELIRSFLSHCRSVFGEAHV